MMRLLYIYILWVAACVDSISADPHITVTAEVGSTALLPCTLRNVFTSTSLVRWHANNKVVFEQSSDGLRYEDPEYKGRVDVPEEELRKGNCSLVLKNVRITDDYFYKTFVVEHVESTNPNKEINRVKLSVVFQIVSARVGSTVILPCKWGNQFIQTPHVEWCIDPEVVFERKGKESFPGEGYEGRVDVPEEELLKGNCSLVLKNITATDETVYSSSILVEHTKEIVLVQKVKLSVYEKPEERKNKTSSPSGEAGVLITSLLVCLLFLH